MDRTQKFNKLLRNHSTEAIKAMRFLKPLKNCVKLEVFYCFNWATFDYQAVLIVKKDYVKKEKLEILTGIDNLMRVFFENILSQSFRYQPKNKQTKSKGLRLQNLMIPINILTKLNDVKIKIELKMFKNLFI